MKRICYVVLLALAVSLPARADFNDGIVAYLMGDYSRAFTTMQSLAETADHGYAQYYLGIMYLKGQGVAQDDDQASHWLREAAEKRIPQAQYSLGELYMNGQGVPRDYEFAYIWFNVAAAHGHEKSNEGIQLARQKLTQDQVNEADRMTAEFVNRYGPKEGEEGQIIQVPAR